MALASNTSYPVGTSGLNTSTPQGAVYTPPPVGQQTTNPNNNIPKSPNTTPTPAPIDLSSSYGKSSNGTIYKLGANGQNTQSFSNPADFFASSGQKSFNNLKFSPYTPTGNETVYGSTPAALNFGTPASSGSGASGGTSTGMLQTLAANQSQNAGTATSTGNPTATTTPANNGANYGTSADPLVQGGGAGVSSGKTVGTFIYGYFKDRLPH